MKKVLIILQETDENKCFFFGEPLPPFFFFDALV